MLSLILLMSFRDDIRWFYIKLNSFYFSNIQWSNLFSLSTNNGLWLNITVSIVAAIAVAAAAAASGDFFFPEEWRNCHRTFLHPSHPINISRKLWSFEVTSIFVWAPDNVKMVWVWNTSQWGMLTSLRSLRHPLRKELGSVPIATIPIVPIKKYRQELELGNRLNNSWWIHVLLLWRPKNILVRKFEE